MDKVAELKSIAKGLAAGGILGAGAGIAAKDQIQKNNNNARTVKGWDTRRKNAMTKEANTDTSDKAKSVVRSVATNIGNPAGAVADYAGRRILSKARKLVDAKPESTHV